MKKSFRVEDLDCANCARELEEALAAIPGVNKAVVSFMAQKVMLDIDEAIVDSIEKDAVKVAKKNVPECTLIF
jgi:copper chaperone CopZ